MILGKEVEIRDPYDHVEIYPRNFAPEKPKRSKLINGSVRSDFAYNKDKDMAGMENLVSLGSCYSDRVFIILIICVFRSF